MGTRRPAFSALCAALLNANDCTDACTMRVAHCRPATPKTPRQSPYFQELEPFSSKPRSGWMHLFKHKDARGSTGDPKVARRTQSTLARPQGVLDLMENSWCVAIAALEWTVHDVLVCSNEMRNLEPSVPACGASLCHPCRFGPDAANAHSSDSNISVHDSADSFGGAHRHLFHKAHSQGAQASSANPRQAATAHPSYRSPTGTLQAAHQHAAAATQTAGQPSEPKCPTDGHQDARLGTWAHRQIRFPWPRKTAELFDSAGSRHGTAKTEVGSPSAVSTPTKIPGSPDTASPLPPPSLQKPPPAPRRPSTDQPSRQSSADDEDTKLVEAAWRWRFGRRWVQEQAKQFDPDFKNEDAEEEWDDALGYLDACGPGFNMIARTSSEFGGNDARLTRTHSLVSQDSGVSKSLNSLLLDDGSYSQQEV